jgi:inward rectifier potassium channel
MADETLKPILEVPVQDLGFGSVVAQESRERLLNRDGTFNVQRKGLGLWASVNPFHFVLTISWLRFLVLVGMSYIAMNGLFAVAYMLCGPSALQGPALKYFEYRFEGAFFFSVQTLATIGYGGITPVGFAANGLVTLESLVGLLSFALVTGILFSRFSRPIPKIRFSKNALIAPYRNITAFEFRIANVLRSEIIQLQATVMLSRFEIVGGLKQRRFYELKLERPAVVFFPLSWTIVHPIDDQSPLKGVTEQELLSSDAEFLVLLSGMDETFSQNVQTRSSYKAAEILWNARFRNIFVRDSEGRSISIDVSLLDEIEK